MSTFDPTTPHVSRAITGRDLAIGVLSVTAAILLATLILVQSFGTNRVFAAEGEAQPAAPKPGLLVTPVQLDPNVDLLAVFNPVQKQLNIYGFNVPLGVLEIVTQIDVQQIERRLQQAAPQTPEEDRDRRRRR